MQFLMNTPSRASLVPTVLAGSLVWSVAFLVVDFAHAQTQVQPQRIGGEAVGSGSRIGGGNSGSRGGVVGGINKLPTGSGNALGDGTGMGGQTFSWSRGTGSGRALGSGNILDRNSQVGSGGSNNASMPVDYYARNLIVTDSVPGGRGFRGSVGYTADTDFRGLTGSDSTYQFRAGSALSNPAFIASPIYKDRFLVGQGLGVFEYRRDSTPIGVDAQRAVSNRPDSRLRLDRANAEMAFGTMNQKLGEERAIARGQAANGDPIQYIVSPLRGLQAESLVDPIVRAGLGAYEQARARADIRKGLARPSDYDKMGAGATRLDLQVAPTSVGEEARIAPQNYRDLLEAVDKKATEKIGAATDAGSEKTKSGLERVRSDIEEMGMGIPKAIEDTATKRETESTKEPKPAKSGEPSLISGDGAVPQGAEAEREVKRIEERGKLLPVPEMAEILRHGKKFDQLGSDDRRRVDDLIRQGEEALRNGEYFQAERRFGQAQVLASDNPLIEAGIAHAQIGAGLYLSAGLTLRNLFEAQPELIDARYDAKLLPTGGRLDEAVTLMRTRILRGDDAPGYGLVLAYIGHQTENRTLVEEGLAAVSGNDALDASRELFKGIWLGGK